MSEALSVIATLISSAAFGLSILIWIASRTQDRRDLFLKMHERLIDADLQRGRQILAEEVSSVDHVVALRRDRFEDYQVVGRSLAMFDVLALYAERNYIDKKLVIEEWGYTLAVMWVKGQHYIVERTGRQEAGTWSGWPHFEALGKEAARWVEERQSQRSGVKVP